MDPVKTLISRLDEGFDFLGFSLKQGTPLKNKITFVLQRNRGKVFRYPKRTTSRRLTIYPAYERIVANLIRNTFCEGKKLWPIAKSGFVILDEFEIVLKFRQIVMGLVNYYRECDNLAAIHSAFYVLQYSCAKTLSYRQKSSVSQIFDKYGKNLTINRDVKGAYGTIKQRTVSFPIEKGLLVKTRRKNPELKKDDKFDPFRLNSYNRTK